MSKMAALSCHVVDCVLLFVIFIVMVTHTDSKSTYSCKTKHGQVTLCIFINVKKFLI